MSSPPSHPTTMPFTLPQQVRKYMRSIIKPGIALTDMCETLEETVRKLIDARGLDAGGAHGAAWIVGQADLGIIACHPR